MMITRNLRNLVLGVACTACLPAWADIVVSQVAAFSGPLAPAGEEQNLGARVYFESVNAKGGIHGERIRLVHKDDAYKPDETVRLVRETLEQDKPIALLGLVGTANIEALAKSGLLEQHRVPVVGMSSGALSLRDPLNRYLFHVRASYRDEVAKIVDQMRIMGLTRVAVFYQDDPFGQGALAALHGLARSKGLELVARAPYQRNTTNVENSVDTIVASNPQALVLLSNTGASIGLLKRFRTPQNKGIHVLGLSINDGVGLSEAIGKEAARGIGISQVMPNAYVPSTAIVREFHEHLKQYAKPDTAPSYTMMEGYVAAKVLVEGLRRAGRKPTPAKLLTALGGMKRYDAGGFVVGFSPTNHEGSRYVELSVVGGKGRAVQ